MPQESLQLRTTFILGFFVLICVFVFFLIEQVKNTTTLVFCDVGQGDAAYIRIENKVDVLIDAGPNNKVLSCLGKHMPFYDREIEFAFLSHPQKDHYGGFSLILDRYKIQTFVASYIKSNSKGFHDLLEKLKQKNTNVLFWYAKSEMIFSERSSASLIWPTSSYISNTNVKDPNIYSQIIFFSLGDHLILFTGDTTPLPQSYFIDDLYPVNILKVPHHGSKNGLSKKILLKVRPEIAVISSGKNNNYGHPSKEIVQMLQNEKVTIKRTDQEGDVVFTFD